MRIASSAVVLAIGVLTMLGTPAARARETVSKQALIRFSSERTGSTRSYVIRADGTGLEQLPRATMVAPNGRAVAHLDLRGDGGDLSVETAGGTRRHLDTGGYVGDFSWSPDGTRIVYADRRIDSRYGRRPMTEIDIVSGRKIALPPGLHPSWSPDGEHIAFFRLIASGGTRLWVSGADGSHPHQVFDGVLAGYGGVGWAPDGKRLAFVADNELWTAIPTAAPTSYGVDRITTSAEVWSWSPDGTRIVFGARDRQRSKGLPSGSVFVANADGTHQRRLVKEAFLSPVWSPTGDEIALVGTSSDSRWTGLFVVRPDGRGLRRLLETTTYGADWSSDGMRLVATTSADISIVDLDGHTRRIGYGLRYGYSDSEGAWLPSGTPYTLLHGTPVSWSLPTDSVATPNLLKSPLPVAYLVADGSRVTIGYGWQPGSSVHAIPWCLETLDTATGKLTRYAETNCGKPAFCCSLGAFGMGDLAFDGNRLTWVRLEMHFAGHGFFGLHTATAAAPDPTWIRSCSNGCVFDAEGGGGLTVFDSWYESCTNPSYPMPCAFAPRRFDALYRVDGDRAVLIAASRSALAPLSVDAGRVLVDHQDGTLEILSSTGASLGTFHYQPGNFLGARLQGNDLVVLTQAFVDDYAADTGNLLHEWPLAGGSPRLEGVHSGVVAYVANSYVYIVRLADGRTVALPQLGQDPHAQITAAGLFYAYQVDDDTYPGRVSFTPFDSLPFG